MTGIYYADMLDVLRAAGCRVAENGTTAGWQTRARSSGGFPAPPLAVFWHHTASSASPDNDLAYMCHNADDAPIGNMLLDRDGVFWPIAAGASNCAGQGGPANFSRGQIPVDGGNTRGFQIEAANNGVGEQWPQAQIDAYFAGSNALNAHVGNRPDDVISHQGWTDRKIDPATAAAVRGPWVPRSSTSSGTWNLDDIRDECWARSIGTDPPPPPPEDSLMYTLFDIGGYGGETYGGYMDANGIFGQITWLSPQRANAYLAAGADHLGKLSPTDLANTDLLGPCPPGTPPSTFANVIG